MIWIIFYINLIFEIKYNSISNEYEIVKIGPEEDFILYDKIYTGNNIFHLKKLNNEDFVVVFPIDETKKEFYFSIIQYKNNILSLKEGYENIPLSFQYKIQGLKFLKINSYYAISFFYLNNEEENEIQEVYFSYLTNKKCKNLKVLTYRNMNKELDFRKFIYLDLISPDPDTQKIKIDNKNSSSISFFYDNSPINKDQFYEYTKWSFNSGNNPGEYEILYSVYSSNDYNIDTCKITFKIINEELTSDKIIDGIEIIEDIDTTDIIEVENKDNIINEYIILEKEIKNKIEDLKLFLKINFENNTLFETEYYKINFYNTSKSSQDNAIEKKGITNINLLGCEKILKNAYNIPDKEVLNIIKVEIKRNDTISLQVEYEIYSEELQLLDLNYCKDEIIRLSIPYNLKDIKKNNFRKLSEEISLEEKYKLGLKYDYDILNSNSPFYNDICTPFDSEYSTDLIIEDRKQYYYMTQLFCEDTCTYSSYNISNNKVDCDCYTKTEPKYNINLRNFANNTIDASFNKKKSNTNIIVFQCLGKGFNNFHKNIGVWVILIIFICFCVLSIFTIYFQNNINKLKEEVGDEISEEENSSIKEKNMIVMSYELALLNDKRKYYEIYFDIIKYNHLISFTFISKIYGNNIYLKINMFLFFIVLLFLFNLFLFVDKYFTYIYLNEGKYNFGNEIPMPIVAVLICLLINMVIRLLLKEDMKNLKIFKRINNTSKNITNIVLDVPENIKSNKKIIFFSFIGVIVNIITFFYVISFGGNFINRLKFIIIRIIFSIIISFIIPFILCFIYAFLRYLALKMEIELLYKISLIVQNY